MMYVGFCSFGLYKTYPVNSCKSYSDKSCRCKSYRDKSCTWSGDFSHVRVNGLSVARAGWVWMELSWWALADTGAGVGHPFPLHFQSLRAFVDPGVGVSQGISLAFSIVVGVG